MRTIQIQLLLSNTLHRQLFIRNLRMELDLEGGSRLHYQNMSKQAERAGKSENFFEATERGSA